MAPSHFFIRLQRGITGGFAPPKPSAIHLISREDGSSELQIQSMVRGDSGPDLVPQPQRKVSISDAEALLDELESILKEIPTEEPVGSSDIYGLDIGIGWGSDDLEWANGGPQGPSAGGISSVEASDEQRVKFQRAIDIITELVNYK